MEFARHDLDPCGRIDGVAEKNDLAMPVAQMLVGGEGLEPPTSSV